MPPLFPKRRIKYHNGVRRLYFNTDPSSLTFGIVILSTLVMLILYPKLSLKISTTPPSMFSA